VVTKPPPSSAYSLPTPLCSSWPESTPPLPVASRTKSASPSVSPSLSIARSTCACTRPRRSERPRGGGCRRQVLPHVSSLSLSLCVCVSPPHPRVHSSRLLG
jgi:hypothetical protein